MIKFKIYKRSLYNSKNNRKATAHVGLCIAGDLNINLLSDDTNGLVRDFFDHRYSFYLSPTDIGCEQF